MAIEICGRVVGIGRYRWWVRHMWSPGWRCRFDAVRYALGWEPELEWWTDGVNPPKPRRRQ